MEIQTAKHEHPKSGSSTTSKHLFDRISKDRSPVKSEMPILGLQGLQWGKIGKNKLGYLLNLLGHFYGKYVEIIGLKAAGNDSDQFGSNKISVLLCEGPKPPNSMISGFVNPY